jgi:hypothetical protein
MPESGGIYTESEEEKAEGKGQSETRNEEKWLEPMESPSISLSRSWKPLIPNLTEQRLTLTMNMKHHLGYKRADSFTLSIQHPLFSNLLRNSILTQTISPYSSSLIGPFASSDLM